MRLSPQEISAIFPVSQVEKFPNGVLRLVRKSKLQGMYIPETRGKIVKCNKNSLVRLMAMLQATSAEFFSMMTLTYPRFWPKDGKVVKADINAFLQKMRRDNMGTYVWFLEFQRRGAPHVHVLLQAEEITPKMRADFAFYWAHRLVTSEWFVGDCPIGEYTKHAVNVVKVHMHPKSWFVLQSAEGAKRYVMKYAAKEKQKSVPKAYRNVGRFWGMSRDVTPESHIADVTEPEVREYLKRHGYKAAEYEVLPKYAW